MTSAGGFSVAIQRQLGVLPLNYTMPPADQSILTPELVEFWTGMAKDNDHWYILASISQDPPEGLEAAVKKRLRDIRHEEFRRECEAERAQRAAEQPRSRTYEELMAESKEAKRLQAEEGLSEDDAWHRLGRQSPSELRAKANAPARTGGRPRPHQPVDQNAHLRKIMDSRKLKEKPHALLCALVLHHAMGRRHKKNFGAATPFAASLMMQETGLSERQVQAMMKFVVEETHLYKRVDDGKGGRGAKGKTAATYVPVVPTWW